MNICLLMFVSCARDLFLPRLELLIFCILLFSISICTCQSRNEYIVNPNQTQYFVAGSAFTLPGGTFLYKNTNLFLHSISFGLTDNVSLGVGTEFYRFFTNAENDRSPSLYLLAPKLGFQLAPKVYFAVGGDVVFYRDKIFEEEEHTGTQKAGLGYALLTYGTFNRNLTVGGYAVPTNEGFNEKVFIFNVSAIRTIGRKVAIVGESWFFPDKTKAFDGGTRFFGNRAAVDLGLATYFENDNEWDYTIIPYFDYTWSF